MPFTKGGNMSNDEKIKFLLDVKTEAVRRATCPCDLCRGLVPSNLVSRRYRVHPGVEPKSDERTGDIVHGDGIPESADE